MHLPYPANLIASVALAADLLASMALAIPAHAKDLMGAVADLEEVGDLLLLDAHNEKELSLSA